MSKYLPELQGIFRDILDQPDLVLTRESNAHNVEDWDSLAHINLVTGIERHFQVRFALGELQELKDVGDLLDCCIGSWMMLGAKELSSPAECGASRTGEVVCSEVSQVEEPLDSYLQCPNESFISMDARTATVTPIANLLASLGP